MLHNYTEIDVTVFINLSLTQKGKKLQNSKLQKIKKKPRKPGKLKGKIRIKKDFDELPEEFMEHFK